MRHITRRPARRRQGDGTRTVTLRVQPANTVLLGMSAATGPAPGKGDVSIDLAPGQIAEIADNTLAGRVLTVAGAR